MRFLATLALIVAPLLAQAQQTHTYLLKIVLNDVTYQGEFVWTPNTVSGCVGPPTAGRGTFAAVSISDPPVTLTRVSDSFYAGDCLGQQGEHYLYFTDGGAGADISGHALNVVLANAVGLASASVPIREVHVYQASALVASCAPCTAATITQAATSANGTTIPIQTSVNGAGIPGQIVDSQHNLWTMVNGKAVLNGTPTPSSGVVMMLYTSGVVYQENLDHLWWKWVNGAWVADTSSHKPYSCPAP
jgi:hypothetical protein